VAACPKRRFAFDATGTRIRASQDHSTPEVVLTVDAAAMHAAGHTFYQAANGVWLTDHVPPGYLSGWPGPGRT
jgi:putative RNA 2'-phosphotransferase